MSESDRYKAAWRGRRWRLLALLAGLLALFLILRLRDSDVLGAACLGAMALALVWFYRFPCPRCGQRFLADWRRLIERKRGEPLRCGNCGLAVNEIPEETKA